MGTNLKRIRRLFCLVLILFLQETNGAEIEAKQERSFFSTNVKERMISSIIPALTRPLMAFPFDFPVIWKQVKSHNYKDVMDGIRTKDISLSQALNTHLRATLVKSCYTYPVAAYFPILFQYAQCPKFPSDHPVLYRILLSGTLAGIDGAIYPFLERDRVNRFYHGKSSYWAGKNEYMKTAKLTAQSTFIGLLVFFTLNDYLRITLQNRHPESPLALKEFIFMGGVIGSAQSLVIYPLQTLRTQLQADSLVVKDESFSFRQTISSLYKSGQLRSLYSGVHIRIMRMFLIATFDSYWLTQIESSK